MSREKTDLLLAAIEDGVLDKDMVILACVKFLSEDDVERMLEMNEMICRECGEISCECEQREEEAIRAFDNAAPVIDEDPNPLVRKMIMPPQFLEDIRFVVGETYEVRSTGDYDCVTYYRCKGRSKKFVKLIEVEDATGTVDQYNLDNGWFSRKIEAYNGVESCFPCGHYSMAPILKADKVAKGAK